MSLLKLFDGLLSRPGLALPPSLVGQMALADRVPDHGWRAAEAAATSRELAHLVAALARDGQAGELVLDQSGHLSRPNKAFCTITSSTEVDFLGFSGAVFHGWDPS